jgi:hypothetical protein
VCSFTSPAACTKASRRTSNPPLHARESEHQYTVQDSFEVVLFSSHLYPLFRLARCSTHLDIRAFETESSQRTACVHVVRAMLGHGRHALLCHAYGRTLARPAYAGGWVNAGWRAPSPFPAKGSAWGLSTHLPCPRPGSLPRQAAAPPRLAAVSSPGFTTSAGGSAAPPRRLALPCPRPGSLPRQAAAPPRLAGLLCRVLAPVNYRGRRQRRPASQACSAVSSPRLTTPAGGSAAPPRRLARPRIATAHAHTVCRRCLFAILTLYAFLCQMAAAAAPAAANAPAPHAVEPWHYWDNNYRVVDLDTIAALSGVTWSKRSLSKREKSEELHAAGLAASGARPNRPAPASPLPPKVRKRGNTLSALPPPSHARTA